MLKAICKLHLPDRPFHTSVSTDGRRFVACSPAGKCRLFDNDLRQLDEIDFGTGLKWVQLDDTGSLLLVGFHDRIESYFTSGNLSPSLKVAIPGTSIQCCAFHAHEHVVCVASWSQSPVLTALDLASGAVVAETPLPDRGGAGYSLVAHPEGEAMAAIACSGQSEEWMFWAHYSRGRLRVFTEPEIEDVALPSFHPTGRECASYHDRLGLCRVRFPSGEIISSVSRKDAFPGQPHANFSYDVLYSRDDRLLVSQDGCGILEFDLLALRPVREVLREADGLTYGENHFFLGQFWRLASDRLLTADCQYDHAIKARTDTLRVWDTSALFRERANSMWLWDGLEPTFTSSSERPYTKQLLAMC